MPDYSEQQLSARSETRARFADGTRVEHLYRRGRGGTVVKLHGGTLKRPRPVGAWRASVLFDGAPKATIHELVLLRVIA